MISFPNGKINLGLQVTGKRYDGFHDLETIFCPVAVKDVLEIVEADIFSFSCSGITIEDSDNNLCIKTYQLLKKDYPDLPAVKIHLHKAIPVGAGLGGGSSDAVSCMQLLDNKFRLQIPEKKMMEYALALGSDCPLFLNNKPCLATGRGEQLKEIKVDLTAYKMLIIHPGIHINTGWAFSQIKSFSPSIGLEKAVAEPIAKWKDIIINDFEKAVFPAHPAIAEIKNEMYQKGAIYASMSGSGSSVYGLFAKGALPSLNFPANYFSMWL